jgi:hypothetical protein
VEERFKRQTYTQKQTLYTNLYVKHVYSRTTLWNSGEEKKEKRVIVNTTEIHNICTGRGYKDMY